ncbi:MAG: nucleotidyltransferase domain-containing protein [Oscillospiraceae bacterium]|nr:nucleotidyltransferase domain-containing protein [Oscillospiraceae bacterium]
MIDLETRNQKIINAVIEKADKVCPGALALIGVGGSFARGDFYEKSDLDLLIVINDERGWQLGCTFIQDDLDVGHDIYCTSWESLQKNALYNDPNIAKLLDSKIVYCSDEKYMNRLEELKEQARQKISQPLSWEDYFNAENSLKEAEHFYSQAMTAEQLPDVFEQAGYAIYHMQNAVALLNKKYFRYGVNRAYEELEQMENKPEGFCQLIENVISGNSREEVQTALTALLRETVSVFKKAKQSLFAEKNPPTAETLRGTYEEMYSNWHNKMHTAAKENNRHLAFMSMTSLSAMFAEIKSETDIGEYSVFENYHPHDLEKTAQAFDSLINGYLKEYQKTGLQAERYRDIDEFTEKYLRRK